MIDAFKKCMQCSERPTCLVFGELMKMKWVVVELKDSIDDYKDEIDKLYNYLMEMEDDDDISH